MIHALAVSVKWPEPRPGSATIRITADKLPAAETWITTQ
jgi:hypothetical protein